MNIIVCIKQVPDTSDIKWTDNNTIQREGVESIVNPFDLYALETALKLKDNDESVKITALTMGPSQAENVLKKAIAIGCDEGILLSDKKFAAADTVATSKTLGAAIKNKLSGFDLIICGQFAIDGDTAQTGPSVASFLDIPQVTYVKEVLEKRGDILKLKRQVEDGIEIVEVKLPALICVLKSDKAPMRAKIDGFISAHKAKIKTYGMQDLELESDQVGLKGSPTYVSKAFRPEQKHICNMIKPNNIQDAVEILKREIQS